MPTPFNDPAEQERLKQLLARISVIQNPCDLDLLIFLHRHPRTFLTSEQVATFVGYDLKEIARALDAFIEAGLLERTTQQSMHAARMFLLQVEGPHSGGVRALLEFASSREGRQSILQALNAKAPSRAQIGPALELRVLKCA
jgi:hypothetical protein